MVSHASHLASQSLRETLGTRLKRIIIENYLFANNVFGVAVNVMINKSSFALRIKSILSKSVVNMLSSCRHNGKSHEVR